MGEIGVGTAMRRTLSWRERTLSFLEAGSPRDPAIVLLHGVGSGSESWRDQLEGLPRHGFRVIAWDQPGYGRSDPLPIAAPSPADYADAVAALADGLELPHLVLLGHSLGALVAAAFAAGKGAARVQKLILAAPTTGFAGAAPELLRVKVQQRIDDMTRLGPALLAEQRAKALLSPNAPVAAVERVRMTMSGLNPEGYVQAVKMLGQGDLLAQAPALVQPALVISGSADTVTPEDSCRRIAAAMPNAQYVSLPGLGHACYIEDAHAFDTALLTFLHMVKA